MMAAEPVFIDTNILVYATQAGRGGTATPQHRAAEAALKRRQRANVELWVSRQVLREYLSAVTRAQGASPALPMAAAVSDVRLFTQLFTIAEDGSDVSARLLDLLGRYPTGGRQVHDANIVATMLAHGVTRLLTANGADFARFRGEIDLEPL